MTENHPALSRLGFGLLVASLLVSPSRAVIDPFTWGFAGAATFAGIYVGFESLKCGWTECCSADWIKPDMNGLKRALEGKLHGQHLVHNVLMNVLTKHLSRKSPSKALVIAFHGSTGTGKNYASKMIAEHLFKEGLESKYVHLFIATRHFMHHDQAATYKDQLQRLITEHISRCEQSLFIFDEVDKMPPGVLEAIVPFIDFHPHVDGKNFRRAIFIFLSNTGGTDVTKLSLKFWREGKNRESIEINDLEELILQGAFNEDGGFQRSYIVQKHLVDHYIPFLPLERKHVRECIKEELNQRGPVSDSTRNMAIEKVVSQLTYGPAGKDVFSVTGCKHVSALLDRVLDN